MYPSKPNFAGTIPALVQDAGRIPFRLAMRNYRSALKICSVHPAGRRSLEAKEINLNHSRELPFSVMNIRQSQQTVG